MPPRQLFQPVLYTTILTSLPSCCYIVIDGAGARYCKEKQNAANQQTPWKLNRARITKEDLDRLYTDGCLANANIWIMCDLSSCDGYQKKINGTISTSCFRSPLRRLRVYKDCIKAQRPIRSLVLRNLHFDVCPLESAD